MTNTTTAPLMNLDQFILDKHNYSLSLLSIFSSNLSSAITIDNTLNRACKSHSITDRILLVPNTCTKISYNILHKKGGSCNIYLQVSITASFVDHKLLSTMFGWNFVQVYKIKIFLCPLGFALNELLKICQCDEILKSITTSTDSCNIDTQTILRSANSWII